MLADLLAQTKEMLLAAKLELEMEQELADLLARGSETL